MNKKCLSVLNEGKRNFHEPGKDLGELILVVQKGLCWVITSMVMPPKGGAGGIVLKP